MSIMPVLCLVSAELLIDRHPLLHTHDIGEFLEVRQGTFIGETPFSQGCQGSLESADHTQQQRGWVENYRESKTTIFLGAQDRRFSRFSCIDDQWHGKRFSNASQLIDAQWRFDKERIDP